MRKHRFLNPPHFQDNFLFRYKIPVCGPCHITLGGKTAGISEQIFEKIAQLRGQGVCERERISVLRDVHQSGLMSLGILVEAALFPSELVLGSDQWLGEFSRLARVAASAWLPRVRGFPSLEHLSVNNYCALRKTKSAYQVCSFANLLVCRRDPNTAWDLLEDFKKSVSPRADFDYGDLLRRESAISHCAKVAEEAVRQSVSLFSKNTARVTAAAALLGENNVHRAEYYFEVLRAELRQLSWLHRAELYFLEGISQVKYRNLSKAYKSLIRAQYILAVAGIHPPPDCRGYMLDGDITGLNKYIEPGDLLAEEVFSKAVFTEARCWDLRSEALLEDSLKEELWDELYSFPAKLKIHAGG